MGYFGKKVVREIYHIFSEGHLKNKKERSMSILWHRKRWWDLKVVKNSHAVVKIPKCRHTHTYPHTCVQTEVHILLKIVSESSQNSTKIS